MLGEAYDKDTQFIYFYIGSVCTHEKISSILYNSASFFT